MGKKNSAKFDAGICDEDNDLDPAVLGKRSAVPSFVDCAANKLYDVHLPKIITQPGGGAVVCDDEEGEEEEGGGKEFRWIAALTAN